MGNKTCNTTPRVVTFCIPFIRKLCHSNSQTQLYSVFYFCGQHTIKGVGGGAVGGLNILSLTPMLLNIIMYTM